MTIEGSLTPAPGAPPLSDDLKERLARALIEKGEAYHPRTRHITATGEPRFTNRLIFESSPYLQQHAHNPVNWYPWGDEAFEAARAEGKLIFLSIGYSTCHWCHVMEQESFDDVEVAALLNEHFIAIKVDREERPDIDNVFMAVCQAMTGAGGWPLTLVLTPEGGPVFAGTYFPKYGRGGRPGMMELLPSVHDAWEKNPDEFERVASRIAEAMREQESHTGGGALPAESIKAAYAQLEGRFDPIRGGFGQAPKFPTPHQLTFLLRAWRRYGDPSALEMVEKTLEAMRLGGIYDQLGFGFHRYSTDPDWLIPHFEKMLYDQALLATAYIEAFQATGRGDFARTAREIFAYVLRDMTDPAGGFYSAEDADSDGEEGKFYHWTAAAIRETLGEEEGAFFIRVFNVEEEGNFPTEVPGRASGENILYLRHPVDRLADGLEMEPVALEERVEADRRRLFDARERRVHPFKDDKVLTAWNGLMISALAKGSQALGDPSLGDAARRAADFLLERMVDEDGRLLRRWRDGDTGLPAHVDDYAFLVQGLLDLYEATFDIRYLREAIRINDRMVDLFRDPAGGGLFFTAEEDGRLIVRKKEIYDGALPSGNSVAALNLLRLERMTGRPAYGERADEIFATFAAQVASYPAGFTQLLVALDFRTGPTFEVVITGRPGADDTRAMLGALRRAFVPNRVTVFRPAGEAAPPITEIAGYTRDQTGIDGVATAYVCRDFACRAPTSDIATMMASLGVQDVSERE